MVAFLLVLVAVDPAVGATASGELFYTTYSPAAVKKVSFTYDTSGFRIGDPELVASLPGADGLAFAPDGDLLVGGGSTGLIFKVNPASGALRSAPAGVPGAYHVTSDPDGKRAWSAGLPGPLAEVPLNPFGAGGARAVSGDDASVTSVAFTPGGATFYTASDAGGGGGFGTIDLATFTTKRLVPQLRAAHGLTFDAYTGNLLLFGSFAIDQIDPAAPTTVRSERLLTDMRFDQGTTDGHGHLFVADNGGELVFIDYTATGRIGDARNRTVNVFLDHYLDDLAPLSGPGAPPAKTGSRRPILPATLVAVVLAVAATRLRTHRRRTGRRRR
jgi:hypothetical protein